jgi:mxaJ protein
MNRIPLAVVACAAVLGPACSRPAAPARELRVCADPNNLPFSNDRLEGFENRIASLVAADMGVPLRYTWWAQRRGFLRNTLNAGACDVVIGLPTSVELASMTRPYYRSTYVFVTRRDAAVKVQSFNDPALRDLRIGVQLVGDDGANSPPVHALGSRGIVGGNVVGYSVFGDYLSDSPPSRIVRAVAEREVDVAVVWGPLAGYFAPRQRAALDLVPVDPQIDVPFMPFVFDISMAVRRDDVALFDRLDRIVDARRSEIDAILAEYHVPRVDLPEDDNW